MKTFTRAALVLILLGGLIGCKSSSGDGDQGNGDIIPPASGSSSTSSSGGNITNTPLPILEDFGSYTNFDQADIIDFFSTNYMALATPAGSDPRPSFYYPTCCFFESDDPTSNITVDHQNRMGIISDNGDPSLLLSNTRFSIGQTLSTLASASATDPKKDSTPGSAGAGQSWGELDLSQPYKISFCVADASGTGSSTQIYVDNNTTGEANSIHGGGSTGSRIFNVPTSDLIPGQRVEIEIPGDTTLMPGGPVVTTKTAQVGTANSFLQFRISSGGTAIIDDLLIEYQNDVGNTTVPGCEAFVPATAPATPAAPDLTAGDEQISVSWSSVLSATSYDVLYTTQDSTTAGSPQTIDDVTTTNTTITGLANGTQYYVFVRASNSAGDSAFSGSSSATPAAPAGCTPTTMVPASPTSGILWNVYDGCLDPNASGAVIVDGSTSTSFDFSGSSDPAFFTANDDGTASLNTTTLGDDRSYGDLNGIVNDVGTYPKTFTFIARVNTPTDLHRGFEVEAGFADSGITGSRVKMILRPDSGTDGLIQLERISGGTSSDDTSESEQAMSDGYHIYHVSYTLSDARTITAVVYRDGVDISSSFDLDITDVIPRDGTDNHIRIGENGSGTYRADIDWMVWTSDPTAASLTAAELQGELPEGIGELGSYSNAIVYSEDFETDITTFFTAGYRAISDNVTQPFYVATGGGSNLTITGGEMAIERARYTAGDKTERSTADCADMPTPAGCLDQGDLDLSQPYRISFDLISATATDATRDFIIYVDNNTSSSGSSIHGSASRVWNIEIDAIAPLVGTRVELDFDDVSNPHVGTANSFFQFRTEDASGNGPTVVIDNVRVEHLP